MTTIEKKRRTLVKARRILARKRKAAKLNGKDNLRAVRVWEMLQQEIAEALK